MRFLSRIKAYADTIEDTIGALALFVILGGGLWILHGCGSLGH